MTVNYSNEESVFMGSVMAGDIRKRMRLLVDGEPWLVVDTDFVKPGKGVAFMRARMKNLINGRVLERTYKSAESVEEADVSFAIMQYLYNDGHHWVFMNTQTYEQVEVAKEVVDEAAKWLQENAECEIAMWNGRVVSVTPPIFLELTVTYTEPAVRGDTATSVTKKATLETGAEIDVPLFIETGMKVKVDTRTGEYLGRTGTYGK